MLTRAKNRSLKVLIDLFPPELLWINSMGAYIDWRTGSGMNTQSYIISVPKFLLLQSEPYLDGPYISFEHLEACSLTYNLIINPNIIRAKQILLKNIKNNSHDIYCRCFTADFVENLEHILEHTFVGNKRGDAITGIHYNTSEVKFIRPVGNYSMYSKRPYVFIQKKDLIENKVFFKKAPTTFWPFEWSIERCMTECAIAWHNKVRGNSSDVYIGKTSTGLKIKFCFRGKVLKTVYPDNN